MLNPKPFACINSLNHQRDPKAAALVLSLILQMKKLRYSDVKGMMLLRVCTRALRLWNVLPSPLGIVLIGCGALPHSTNP